MATPSTFPLYLPTIKTLLHLLVGMAVAIAITTTAHAQTVLVDFGQTPTTNAANYWNSYTSNTFLNLANSQGTATAYYFTPNVGAGLNTNFITGSPNLSGIGIFNVPTVYSDALNTTTNASYYFYNIQPTFSYDFTLYGARDTATTRTTLYTLTGTTTGSGSVTTSGANIGGTGTNYNNNTLVNITSITSTNFGGAIGNGILLTLTAESGGFGYLNAMQAYGYLGYRSGGTYDLNSASTYLQVSTNADGSANSADTVIGNGSTVNVNNANGIYYNSTLVMTNGGGTINAGTNFSVYALTGAGNLAVGGTSTFSITHAGTYSGTLSLSGGSLTLSASNALGTGSLTLNGGTLSVGNASALGTGAITVASGTTTVNNYNALTSLTGNNPINLNGGGAIFQVNGYGANLNFGTGNVTVTGTNNLNAWSGGMEFDGVISGSGTLIWYGGGTLTLGGANTFTGTITASGNNGTLMLANTNALQNATLNKGADQTVGFGVAGTNTYNVGALSGTNPAASIALGANSLNVGGKNANTTYAGTISGTGGLTKSGTGTLTLSGTNTYAGATAVTQGTLAINGNNSAATGALTVDSSAKLSGTGTIGGATTISGTHSPGNSPGIQTFTNGLTYNPGSSITWELAANGLGTRGTDFDGVNVTGGTLSFSNTTTMNLSFLTPVVWTDTFWGGSYATTNGWRIYDAASAISGFANMALNTSWIDSLGTNLTSVRPGASFSLYQDVANNDIYLNYDAVPEPSTYAMLVLAAAGFGAHVIRRRRG